MAIRTVEAIEVSCNNCEMTILVEGLVIAWGHGWQCRPGIPVHLCPDCVAKQKAKIATEGFQARLARALDEAKRIVEKG